MKVDITYLSDQDMLYIKYQGEMTYDEAKQAIKRLADLGKNYTNKKILSDHTQVDIFPGAVDVFNLGTQVSHFLQGMNIAVIAREELMENYGMYKRAVNIRGGNIEIFTDEFTAVSWLHEQEVKI